VRARQRPQEVAGLRRPIRHVCSFYLHTCAYASVRIYCQYRLTHNPGGTHGAYCRTWRRTWRRDRRVRSAREAPKGG
jgi:hypothetical protein